MVTATVTYQCEAPDAVKKVTSDGSLTCLLNFGRVLNIAFAFGLSIFVLVYIAASFRSAQSANLLNEHEADVVVLIQMACLE